MPTPFDIRHLAAADLPTLRALNAVFGTAFNDLETYADDPPNDAYLARFLANPSAIALAAQTNGAIIGGLVAYELMKFERERSEIYIYDLAVAEQHRRQGVATALIHRLRDIAALRGAWVMYVQADYGDEPAIALYEKLGVREDVMHFDIAVSPKRD